VILGLTVNERDYPRRWERHLALPGNARRLEAIAPDLRQADDLLSAVHPDVRRHPRHPDISTPEDKPLFQRLLGDGNDLGLRFSFGTQDHPRGLADAFIVGREFQNAVRLPA
jgi:hypothetical protein